MTQLHGVTNYVLAFVSVLVATVLTMITVGVESKGHIPIHATTDVSFREGFLAVTNIIFAYRTWTKTLLLLIIKNPFTRVWCRWAELIQKNQHYSRPRCILRLHVRDRGPKNL